MAWCLLYTLAVGASRKGCMALQGYLAGEGLSIPSDMVYYGKLHGVSIIDRHHHHIINAYIFLCSTGSPYTTCVQ